MTVATTKPQSQGGEAELSLPGNVQANYGCADLRAHQRLSETLARRHRHAGEGRAAARGDRVAGSRSAAAAGPGGSRRRPGERRRSRRSPPIAGACCRQRLRFQAGSGREDQSRRHRAMRRCRPRRRTCSGCASCRASRRSLRPSMASSPRATPTSANSSTRAATGPELFRVADMRQLRLYVHVPQTYAAAMQPNLVAECSSRIGPG